MDAITDLISSPQFDADLESDIAQVMTSPLLLGVPSVKDDLQTDDQGHCNASNNCEVTSSARTPQLCLLLDELLTAKKKSQPISIQVAANSELVQVNKVVKSLLIDLRESAMYILTWVRVSMPEPTEASYETWLTSVQIATDVINWATDHINLFVSYHGLRTDYILQLTNAVTENQRKEQIDAKKELVSNLDIEHFTTTRLILNDIASQYVTLHTHFNYNIHRFRVSTRDGHRT